MTWLRGKSSTSPRSWPAASRPPSRRRPGSRTRTARASSTWRCSASRCWCTRPAPLLATARERATSRGLPTAVYTEDLFATDNDDDNRAAVRAATTAGLNLVGVAVYGPRNVVDKVFKGAALHS